MRSDPSLPGHPPSPGTPTPPAGIYLHVPFCRVKCPYCDFYSLAAAERIPAVVAALADELTLRRRSVALADTVYFGGGTPSLLTSRQVARILARVRACFPVTPDAEITLEVNPGTVDGRRLAGYRAAGVNRLSIGLQSTRDANLRLLGRIHSVRQGIDTYRRARASGFDNLGLDLIYGLPGQTRRAWAEDLAAAVDLAPEHLSCYTLTVEPGTALHERVASGRTRLPDERHAAGLHAFTAAFLNRRGYRQYEISNFARQTADPTVDWRSRHNRKYWNGAPYLGFGPSAHSFLGNRRWWNHRDLDRYLADLRGGQTPVAGEEELTHEQRVIECVYLGLRQTEGIDREGFRARVGRDPVDLLEPTLTRLQADGLVVVDRRRIRLTRRGGRLLEQVVGRLLGGMGGKGDG